MHRTVTISCAFQRLLISFSGYLSHLHVLSSQQVSNRGRYTEWRYYYPHFQLGNQGSVGCFNQYLTDSKHQISDANLGLFESIIPALFFKNVFFCIGVQPIKNVVIVSGEQQRDSTIIYQTPLPSRLPHNIEQSSQCYVVGSFWLSILNTAMCTCSSQTFQPSLQPSNHKIIL